MNLAGITDPAVALVIAVASLLVTVTGLFFTFRAANRKTDSESKTALDARIDARVTEQLSAAWERIDALEAEVEALKSGEQETRRVVRSWFSRLITWDRRGRNGRMPVPTHDEMRRLGIDDLMPHDTQDTPAV